MKKTKVITSIFAAVLAVALCSCHIDMTNSSNDDSGDGGTPAQSSYKAGDLALAKIKIGGIEYENTAQVYVTGPSGAEITGADPSFVDNTASDYFKGVFRTGRKVKLSPYIMSKYEVTQELYEAVMNGNSHNVNKTPSGNSSSPAEGDTQGYRPVDHVSWYDSVYFCNELTKKTLGESEQVYTITDITVDPDNKNISSATVIMDLTKKGYRLPTEAEWEFAARGGDTTKPAWNYLFAGHDTETGKTYADSENAGMNDVGWYSTNSEDKTHQVGKTTANTLGIFDMSGNVWEWCYDRHGGIATGEVTNPSGAASGSYRILRGGGWDCDAYYCSVCCRVRSEGTGFNINGFRVVRSAQ